MPITSQFIRGIFIDMPAFSIKLSTLGWCTHSHPPEAIEQCNLDFQPLIVCLPLVVRPGLVSLLERLEARHMLTVIPVCAGRRNPAIRATTVNGNGDASNTLELSAGFYTISDLLQGDLLVENANNSVAHKTLKIVGAGQERHGHRAGSRRMAGSHLSSDRQPERQLTVDFQDLTDHRRLGS